MREAKIFIMTGMSFLANILDLTRPNEREAGRAFSMAQSCASTTLIGLQCILGHCAWVDVKYSPAKTGKYSNVVARWLWHMASGSHGCFTGYRAWDEQLVSTIQPNDVLRTGLFTYDILRTSGLKGSGAKPVYRRQFYGVWTVVYL